MLRTVISTTQVEKITPLPDDLKGYEALELIITPAHPHPCRSDLKRRFEDIFKKAKDIKIPKDIDIDSLMNEMNDAIL
ncbi:MAG: hypothetical protein ACM3SY_13560 [Candidatus Omnitrophota bacterium]